MTVPTSNMPSLIDCVIAEFAADKKKAAMLGVFTLVALVLGARLVLKSMGPSAAGAAVESSLPGSSASSESPTRGLAEGLTMAGPGAPGQENQRLTGWRSQRPKDGSTMRDLFVTDLKPYVRIESEAVKKEPTTKPEQAMIDMVEVARAVRAQADGLVLQSTMIGLNSSAVINGRVLRVGDYIEGFKIVAVRPRSCDVKKKGIEVSLVMKK